MSIESFVISFGFIRTIAIILAFLSIRLVCKLAYRVARGNDAVFYTVGFVLYTTLLLAATMGLGPEN